MSWQIFKQGSWAATRNFLAAQGAISWPWSAIDVAGPSWSELDFGAAALFSSLIRDLPEQSMLQLLKCGIKPKAYLFYEDERTVRVPHIQDCSWPIDYILGHHPKHIVLSGTSPPALDVVKSIT